MGKKNHDFKVGKNNGHEERVLFNQSSQATRLLAEWMFSWQGNGNGVGASGRTSSVLAGKV